MSYYRKCVAIFLFKDGKIFVGRRIDMKDAWQAPQGGVEESESLLEAAKRELFEETNASTIEALGSAGPYRYDFPTKVMKILMKKRDRLKYIGQEVTFFAFKFLGEDAEINLSKEPQEFADWKWVPPEELLSNIVYFKKPPYERALEEFQKLKIFPTTR